MADDKVQQLRAQMHEDAKSGIITLKTPLRAGGRDVTELAYDFGKLTGWEYADAMDMEPARGQHLQNHAQAGALPVRHGGGQSQRGRGRDGYSRTAGVEDAQTAVEQAMVFLTTSTPEVKRNS